MTNESSFNLIVGVAAAQSQRRTKASDFQIPRGFYYAGAGLGLLGGFLAMSCGLLLSLLSWLGGNEIAASSVGQAGTWLIIATFPAMMAGAHCLDKLDARAKAEKRARRL